MTLPLAVSAGLPFSSSCQASRSGGLPGAMRISDCEAPAPPSPMLLKGQVHSNGAGSGLWGGRQDVQTWDEGGTEAHRLGWDWRCQHGAEFPHLCKWGGGVRAGASMYVPAQVCVCASRQVCVCWAGCVCAGEPVLRLSTERTWQHGRCESDEHILSPNLGL